MIFKRKFKMKNLIHVLLFLILLFAIRTSSTEINVRSNDEIDSLEYELDPSILMPSGVDVDKLTFIDDTHQSEKSNQRYDKKENRFINLVSSNDKTALALKSSNDVKGDSFSGDQNNNNQPQTIVLNNLYINRINEDPTRKEPTDYTNYLPDVGELSKESSSNLDSTNKLQIQNQLNQRLEQYIREKMHQHSQQQRKSSKKIKQLDSKTNLNYVLDQLNILTGSNQSFMRKQQKKIIKNNPGVLTALGQGLNLSMQECKYQFKDNSWNCPVNKKAKGKAMFGKILDRDCRETAYLTAIRSAAITYAIIKACSDGLISTCSCDYRQNINYFSDQPGQSLFAMDNQYSISNYPNDQALRLGIEGIGGNVIQSNNVNQEYTCDFKWSGCSDNFNFASNKGRLMIESHSRDGKHSTQQKIMIHNYRAGRKAVKENMIMVCKCHGMSGTCTMRTCWRRLSSFRKIGTFLKERYNTAVQVIPKNDDELVPKDETISTPTSLDLYYSHASPNFCEKNLDEGSIGTQGRQCDADTSGNQNSCDQLCCGRGHRKEVRIVKYNCNCEFRWCCSVKCNTCKKSVKVDVCV